MEDTITFDIPVGYPEILEVSVAPFTPSYPLAFVKDAGIKCYQHPAFSAVEQSHDARSACFKLLEIHSDMDLRIPVTFRRDDLHWFYGIKGSCQLVSAAGDRRIQWKHQERVKLYANASNAWLLVPKGHFLLLAETFESGWVLRFEEPAVGELREFTEYLRGRKAGWLSSRPRDILTGMWAQIALLPFLPAEDHMLMDALVYLPMARKVQLDRYNGYKPVSADEDPGLVKDIVRLVQAKLQHDPPIVPGVQQLAEALRLNRHQLWEQFKAAVKGSQREGQTIKGIIDLERLEVSKALLKKGLSIQQVAYQLEYSSQSAFGRQFKKYFGTTPGNFMG